MLVPDVFIFWAPPHQFDRSFDACWKGLIGIAEEVTRKFAVQMEAYRLVLSLDGHGLIIETIQQILTHYLVFLS